MAKTDLKAAVIAGTVAGIFSGFVKLGWENVLPPRTPARNAVNPPQHLMEQVGVPEKIRNATYTYSEQKMPIAGFLIHFGFSTSFAILYSVAGHYLPFIKAGKGSLFGLSIWSAFHLGVMPAMKTVPDAKDQPIEEHISEAVGHVVWMHANDFISDSIYRNLTAKQHN
ncbi:hypothetical protein AYR62_00500 [Secundilactobacillus paracollinoides]|uniref:DUF1440 domain-containing protein n=1 Tax=Secundilactobacillus paracollinoides TaxID=240427 RepID=A0A1B2IVR7_9LACO|nr:DUF1440 domain-containing protein [Secundilactobacillus paracollinoides]ANZ60289.1 hypothetical protein AYR61_02255 [Secundilactobacillus paracollinoides]ANZ62725.1 hypothetical protein AYR62_00500 [Secundilactobacillus paracollinoides]ANZ66119.1 hypothetical protein AYR63_02455 [Secundilactobacillus paracollinoides]KRL79106.1 hypothetical protein FC17_GL000726 [Secundilactobacillus paracollinoides DSM 15502 = JCM 11969]